MKFVFGICLSVLLACAYSQDFAGFDGFDASSFGGPHFGGDDLSGFDGSSFADLPDGAGSLGGSDFDGAGEYNLGQFGIGESGRFEGDPGLFLRFQKK
ncbi:unnamed protein product [Larinioides sclopetarius]|uniref:Secreted protein n=1 Tax=Larinioides sclopetarius TaxID=280406 RepID=A0AAV2BB82_9ARAC